MKKFLQTKNLSNLKIMVTAAFFATISFVCGKFLAISIGDTIRFSIENLPLMLSGMLFGPAVGALTGFAADIIGCILRGYAINPIITFASAFIGFSAGVIFLNFKNANRHLRVFISVIFCHIVGSMIIKTIGLYIWYGTPFFALLGSRIINYSLVAAAEIIILAILFKNKSFYNQIIKITGVKNEL